MNSMINKSEIIKYDEFVRKMNEDHRCLEKRDLIVNQIFLYYLNISLKYFIFLINN